MCNTVLSTGDTSMNTAELSLYGVCHLAESLSSGSQYEEGIAGKPVRQTAWPKKLWKLMGMEREADTMEISMSQLEKTHTHTRTNTCLSPSF